MALYMVTWCVQKTRDAFSNADRVTCLSCSKYNIFRIRLEIRLLPVPSFLKVREGHGIPASWQKDCLIWDHV